MKDASSNPYRHRRDVVTGALIVALFALVFLWRPIANLGELVFAPADFSQTFPLTRVEQGVRPANPALVDVWATEQPWLLFSQRHVVAAELPTWNGFSGGGSPHLANPKAAVFSPFSLPYYACPLALATILSSFLKLFALGFFTFLFLRELRLVFQAAVFGAVAFMFAGHQIVGLLSPQASAAFVLPAALFLIERIAIVVERAIVARERSQPAVRPPVGPATALAAVLAAGYFTGGIDTLVFCAGTIVLYALARCASLARRHAHSRALRAELGRGVVLVLGSFAVAGMLSGIQALPYLEALRNARVFQATPDSARFALSLASWPLWVFPDLLGNPSGANSFGSGFPAPEYPLVAAVYVGSLVLALALAGAFVSRRPRAGWFFLGVGALAIAVAYGLFGTSLLHGLLPAQELPLVQRALVVFAFAAAVLAALTIDRLVTAERNAQHKVALAAFGAGFTVLMIVRAFAIDLLERTLPDPMIGGDRTFHALASKAHVDAIDATFLVGLGLVALALALRPGRWRARLAFGITLASFAQTGWSMSDYNPLVDPKFVYPRTVDVDRRVGTVRSRNAIVMNDVDVPPATNAIYGVRSFAVNDPLRIRRYDQLQRRLFEPAEPFGLVTHTTRHALGVFSIECVYDEDRWVDVDTAFCQIPLQRNSWFASAEVLPNAPIEQHFTGFADGIEALQFLWVAQDAPNECSFAITLDDPATGERIAERTIAPGGIVPRGGKPVPCVLLLPPNLRAKGRTFVLRIASDDAVPGHSCAVGCRSDLAWFLKRECARVESELGMSAPASDGGLAGVWRAQQGDARIRGNVALDMHSAYRAFEYEDQVGPFSLFHYTGAPARYHTVGTARVVASDREAWEAVLDDSFAVRNEVVLEAAPPGTARTGDAAGEVDARVEVLKDFDSRVQLVVNRKTPGFVVTPIAWYPGWKARVDNEPSPVLCANYAFTAVAVPAGESLIELEFEPKSLRNGALLSALGFGVLLLGIAACVPKRREHAHAVSP